MRKNKSVVLFGILFILTFAGYFMFHYPFKFQGFFIYEGNIFEDTCSDVTYENSSVLNTNAVLYFRFDK